MYWVGDGVERNWALATSLFNKAREIYKQACDGEDLSRSGCIGLGLMYERGPGLLKDNPRAVALYQQACDRGSGPAPAAPMGDVPLPVYVAQKCPRSVIDAFVKAGAKLDSRSPQGFTPLSMALLVGNLDAAEALVDHGARLSPQARQKLFPETPADARVAALVKRASKTK